MVLAAAGAGYGWLLVSPLPWRLNVSIAVIVLGAPAALLRVARAVDDHAGAGCSPA